MASRGIAVLGALAIVLAFCTPVAASAGPQGPAALQMPACPGGEQADLLLARSAASYAARDAVRGLALLKEAFDIASSNGCAVHRAEALRRLSLADSYALRFDEAALKLIEAAAVFRKHGVPRLEAEALVQLGFVLVSAAKDAEAVEPLKRARALAESLNDRLLLLRVLGPLAYALPEDADKAEFRANALAIARSTPGGRLTECSLLHEWGDQLFGEDRFDEAFVKVGEAVRCFEDVDSPSLLGRAYVSLGRVYRAHGRLDIALQQYVRALTLQQNAAGDPLAAVQSLNAIGVTLGSMGKYDEGLERLEEALGMARRLGSQRSVDFLLANIAAFHLDRGQYAAAAAALEETLASPSPAYGVIRLADLSRAYVGLKQFDRALAAAERAVAQARGDSENVSALSARANALAPLERYGEAANDLTRAVQAVESLRANTIPDDFLKRGFGQNYAWLFSSTIALLQDQGKPREAMETAERARARAFLDLLASRGRSAGSAAAPLAEAKPASFAEIQAAAARLHSTIVSYWVSPAETFVWVVTPSGAIASARIPFTAAQLAAMIREANGASGDVRSAGLLVGGGSGARPWRALYRALVQPIRAHLPARPGSRVTIVPHGPLFGLSFAALRDPSDRYLVESYELHYIPAVAALPLTGTARSGAQPAAALLVGDPGAEAASDGITPLSPLPWAGREVTTVASLFPGRTTMLVGAEATEPRVRELLSANTVVHFATHGIVQNEERLSSYLALRPGAGGASAAAEDGRLTANETYGLHLDADLIVLSGCRTALGPVIGDGVIGFTRAFLAAGASSVVATMWDVEDRTSFELMKAFYGARAAGVGKGRALRQSQLAVIRALRAGRIRANGIALPESPRLWAGFVLVGQP